MKLLIIEDNLKLLRNLERSIAAEKHIVDTATNGEKGFQKAQSGRYDVIVLDLSLPKMDGMEVCKRLREKKVSTPIIMLTARDTPEDRVQGLDSGADDYIIKPFGMQELLARIRSLIRRNTHDATVITTSILRAGNLELDPTTHHVSRNGVVISLGIKEYNLLEFLLRHAGQIITHKELIKHLWNNENNVTSNHLAVFVRYLRKKVDDPYEVKLIQTVRGFGYRINA